MSQHAAARRSASVVAAALLGAACLGGIAHATTVTSGYDTSNGTGSLGPSAPGAAITQAQIISRAQDWMNAQIPYSQTEGWLDSSTGGPYRMDCSGFVSMAWGLTTSMVTSTLPSVATVTASNISGDTNLNPGDALDYTADHVVLFDHWTDSSGDFAYDAEHTYGQVADQTTDNIYDSTLEGYAMSDFEGLRYNNLTTPTASVGDNLFGLAPDKSAVSEYNGTGTGPGAWTVIGGPATQLYTGGDGLFAVNPNNGSINKYNGTPGSWTEIGGPATSFAVTNNAIYGLSSDKSAISVYNGTGSGPGAWTVIGGAATAIYAGGDGLYAVNPNNGSINKYNGTPNSWTQIGGPGAAYTVSAAHIYGLATGDSAVSVYNGTGSGPGAWTQIGGTASQIAATD